MMYGTMRNIGSAKYVIRACIDLNPMIIDALTELILNTHTHTSLHTSHECMIVAISLGTQDRGGAAHVVPILPVLHE